MAAFKFTFFLCAAFLVFQAQALPQHKKVADDFDVMALIKKVVHKAEELLDKVIDIAEKVVYDMSKDQWSDFQAQTVNVTEQVLDFVMTRIIKDLEKMSESSGDDSASKLEKCIAASKDDIVQVPVGFWNDISKCSGDAIMKTVSDFGPTLKDLEAIQIDAKKAADAIDGCEGNDLDGMLCALDVAHDLLTILFGIPAKISEDLKPVMEDVKVLYTTAKQCVIDEESVYFANAGKILATVATCAAA